MEDADKQTPAAGGDAGDYPRYDYKPALMSPPWTFQLTPDDLVWTIGPRSGRTAYRGIRRIRLGFRPVTMQSYRFLAEIWPERGPKIPIASSSWKSLMEQARQDEAYVEFITDLHRRIAQAHGEPKLEAGAIPFLYWPGAVIFAGISLAMLALIGRSIQQGDLAASLFLAGFFALVIWQLGGFFKRNLPRRYTLEAIPPDVLPKAH